MRRVLVSIGVVLLSIAPATARLYQWRSAATGSTQLSGLPPAWYRSDEQGPRIFVFENNQLVDDTGIAVSIEQREALRRKAFDQPGATAQAPAQTPAPPVHHMDIPTSPAPAVAAPTAALSAPVLTAQPQQIDVSDKAAALKSLIDAWDQRQLDQARSLLEMLPLDDDRASDRD